MSLLQPVQKLVLGGIRTNCYLTSSLSHLLVVDPAAQPDLLIDQISKHYPDFHVDILITHGHCDHILAVPELADRYKDASIFVHEHDYEFCFDPKLNYSDFLDKSTSLKGLEDRFSLLRDGDSLPIGDEEMSIIHTPGHSPGSISLYSPVKRCVFTGDTLFRETIGTEKCPRACKEDIISSIRDKLFKLPEDTIVYPGHGRPTTIGHEKLHNKHVNSIF